jgi:hypothetical protein
VIARDLVIGKKAYRIVSPPFDPGTKGKRSILNAQKQRAAREFQPKLFWFIPNVGQP